MSIYSLRLNPVECGAEWAALVDLKTEKELTPRQRYVEGKELVFDVSVAGAGVVGWFAEEHGGGPLFWNDPVEWR